MNSSGKFTVSIFSDANFLAVNIFENLLSKNCFVNVVTSDYNNWKKLTTKLISNSNYKIFSKNKTTNLEKYDSAIFCGGFIEKEKSFSDYEYFLSLSGANNKVKTLVLFPFGVIDKNKIKLNDNTAVLFMGDLLGPGINFKSDLFVSKTIKEIVEKRQMSIGIGEMLYPIFISDAVKLITKWLFSFGPYGKEILILGRATPVDIFWKQNQKLVGGIKLAYNSKILPRIIPKGIDIVTINGNLTESLTETYQWLKNEQTKPIKESRIIKPRSSKRKIIIPKVFKPIMILLVILLVFPFVMLLISISISLIGYKEFTSGKDEGAGNTLLLAKSFAVIAEKESGILNFIPGINIIYREVTFTAGFIVGINEIAFHAIPIIRNGTFLFESVLGSGVYDPQIQTSKISSGLSFLNEDLVATKKLTDEASKDNVFLAGKILTRINFEKYINLTLQGRTLADTFPDILGKAGSKTYLILFQNNMEIRPTGGFIGSYGLLTFDGGRLSDLTVSDVYSADGQLNGHVEPPTPIKNYLGEANWWLRDSNWDPDFPTSAQRAEWFLNKEIGKEVDGVASIDLSPIKEILKETGPVYLSDFNIDITSTNLYEKTQSEVQNNSFPGTHQKASFLTALSRNLLGELVKMNTVQKISILKTFYNALDSRHLQIFLHDDSSQNALASIGWDGSVTLPTCANNCYADTVGLIEANLGVNKANYFIQRAMNLKVNVNSYQIERILTLNLKNTANPALGVAGKYKAYVRLVVPVDAEVIGVTRSSGQDQISISPDITEVKGRKEIGVLIEILGGQSQNLTFSWKSNIPTTPISQYWLYIRKQAGLDILPVSLSISGLSLTRGTPYLYNAILTRDMLSRFSL